MRSGVHGETVLAHQFEIQTVSDVIPPRMPVMTTLTLFGSCAGSKLFLATHPCSLIGPGSLCPSVEQQQSHRDQSGHSVWSRVPRSWTPASVPGSLILLPLPCSQEKASTCVFFMSRSLGFCWSYWFSS